MQYGTKESFGDRFFAGINSDSAECGLALHTGVGMEVEAELFCFSGAIGWRCLPRQLHSGLIGSRNDKHQPECCFMFEDKTVNSQKDRPEYLFL